MILLGLRGIGYKDCSRLLASPPRVRYRIQSIIVVPHLALWLTLLTNQYEALLPTILILEVFPYIGVAALTVMLCAIDATSWLIFAELSTYI